MKKIQKISLVGFLSLALVFSLGVGRANAALTIGALTMASDGALTITTAVGSATNLATTTTTGAINIGTSVSTGDITIGGAQTSGAIAIGGGVQTGTITFGGGTGAQTVNIGTGSTGVKTINLGTGTAANVISIGTGQTGGSISIGTSMTTGTITIGNATSGLLYFQDTETMTSDDTLTIAESGKTFYIGTAGVDLTLPSVSTANGVNYKFIISANFATTSATILTGNSTENVIEGAVDVNSTLVACAAEDTITFVNSAELPGDVVELTSNGTNWFVTGQAVTTGAITCTQAS